MKGNDRLSVRFPFTTSIWLSVLAIVSTHIAACNSGNGLPKCWKSIWFHERTQYQLSPVEIHFLEAFEAERKRLGGTTDINQFKGDQKSDQKSDQKNVQENVQENLTERREAIIEIIVENKSVSLNDLSVSLGVSVKTIQRDIEKII